jgi:8-oxo-dGTP diphosphatase
MQTKDNAKFHIVAVKGWIEKDGKFLIAKRGPNEIHMPNTWSVPGGKVDSTTEEANVLRNALKREIREEVGIEIDDDIELIYDNSFIRSDGAHVVMMIFLCRYKSGKARPLEDTAELKWLTLEELKRLNIEDHMKMEIKALANHVQK